MLAIVGTPVGVGVAGNHSTVGVGDDVIVGVGVSSIWSGGIGEGAHALNKNTKTPRTRQKIRDGFGNPKHLIFLDIIYQYVIKFSLDEVGFSPSINFRLPLIAFENIWD